MNIYELTKKLMNEHGGFVPSLVLLDAIRERDQERWSKIPDHTILRSVADALREHGLKSKNVRVGGRVMRCYGKPDRTIITESLKNI
jgi:hypothetical protein